MRLQLSDGEKVGEDWIADGTGKPERKQVNDNMISHDCLMNGIGLQEETDSNDDRSDPMLKNRRQHDFSITWTNFVSRSSWWLKQLRRSRHRPQQADFQVDWNVRGSLRWTGGIMRCKACDDKRLKRLHGRSELCGAVRRPMDESRCDLTYIRHQNIRVSVSGTVASSQHAEHFAHWISQSSVCVGGSKQQTTANCAQCRSLVLSQNVLTWTRTLHGCRSRWHVPAPDFRWVCCWRLKKTSSHLACSNDGQN